MQIYEMQCKTKTQFANMQDKQFCKSKLNNFGFHFFQKRILQCKSKIVVINILGFLTTFILWY